LVKYPSKPAKYRLDKYSADISWSVYVMSNYSRVETILPVGRIVTTLL
jgi:hypothetical protein